MPLTHPNCELIALGVRQPWAELILRGIKTVEVRSSNTNVRGPIYVYSSKKPADVPAAARAIAAHQLDVETLPFGVLVGTVEIVGSQKCTAGDSAAACVPRELLKDATGGSWRTPGDSRACSSRGSCPAASGSIPSNAGMGTRVEG